MSDPLTRDDLAAMTPQEIAKLDRDVLDEALSGVRRSRPGDRITRADLAGMTAAEVARLHPDAVNAALTEED